MQRALSFIMLLAASEAVQSAQPEVESITIFDEAPIEFDKAIEDGTQRDGHRVFKSGQLLEATVELPDAPANQRDARQIIVSLVLEPELADDEGAAKPGDPWTRAGTVAIVFPPAAASAGKAKASEPAEAEAMRFITPFGGSATFKQDITALAPLLSGKTTFRIFISTYKKPAWKVTLTLTYDSEGVGYRRPAWAKPLFNDDMVTAEKPKLGARVQVPGGVTNPRLWIIASGHATDGTGGDEFISRTHVLRVDGREVARWRPWAENGGGLRDENPMSGHMTIDGRELWSSDLDRSGWHPGQVVQPCKIPLPELTPGKTHTIELEVIGIRPEDETGRGYWRISAIAVADEPWPDQHERP